jgi:PilZ domain
MKTSPDSQKSSASFEDRRRLPRYRYSAPLTIRPSEGPEIAAISFEISENGMSAMVGNQLKVGDTVELDPVGGGKMTAIVRHGTGKLYGFEFVNPSPEQVRNIADRCETLHQFSFQAPGV